MKQSFSNNRDGESSFICSAKGNGAKSVLSCKKKIPGRRESHSSDQVPLVRSFPWEYVDKNNSKTWRFIIENRFPESFLPAELEKLRIAVKKYINTFYYPSWRKKVSILIDYLLTASDLEEAAGDNHTQQMPQVLNPHEYIPIYFVEEFDVSIPDGFGTSVHGGTTDSVANGVNALLYINGLNQFADFSVIPPGTPWAVIARGSDDTKNGIVAEMKANITLGEGPKTFYDVLAHTVATNILEIMGNPGDHIHIANGDTLGLALEEGEVPYENFYRKELCAPFSFGNDNIKKFKGYSMPNFALPCYYHPYVDVLSAAKTGIPSAVYDICGNGSMPLIPYKGIQRIMRQEALDDASPPAVSDMFLASYISPNSDPENIQYVVGGSIYDYESWGFQLVASGISVQQSRKTSNKVKAHHIAKKYGDDDGMGGRRPDAHYFEKAYKRDPINPAERDGWRKNNQGGRNMRFGGPSEGNLTAADLAGVKAIGNSLAAGRKLPAIAVHSHLRDGKRLAKASNSNDRKKVGVPRFDPCKPQLLPFQYIDDNDVLIQRYSFINYAPTKLPPTVIIQGIEAAITHNTKYYLPHWANGIEMTSYTILSDADVPYFDGTFIPFFIVTPEMWNQETGAIGFIAGGAGNLNNVPDAFAGPTIDFYFSGTPDLAAPTIPLGCPFLVCSDRNFVGDCIVTTNVPDLGPFRAGVGVFQPTGFTLPFTAKGVVATPDDTCCVPPTGTTNGVPIAGNILIFGNDPPCATAGPTRYGNVNDSGCAASIAVSRYETGYPGFPSNLGQPYVSEPNQYMVGVDRPVGDALMAESAINPNLEITIGEARFPAPEAAGVLTYILCHETSELNADANYATYILCGDPPSDRAVLFEQLEVGDPAEVNGGITIKTSNGSTFTMEPEPRPAYFIPNLKFESYDHLGLCPNPMIPYSRQQCIGQFLREEGGNVPIYGPQLLGLESSVPGAEYSIRTFLGQNHFNRDNFFVTVPGDPSTIGDEVKFPPDDEISTTPFASIVRNLKQNNNVYYFKYGGVLFPGL